MTEILTILINIFMIYFLVLDDEQEIISDPDWGEYALRICGFMHFACMAILWASFLLKKGKFHV